MAGLVLYVSWMLYISPVLTLVTPRGESVLRLWGFEKVVTLFVCVCGSGFVFIVRTKCPYDKDNKT